MADIELYVSDTVNLRAIVKDVLGNEYAYGDVSSENWDYDSYDGDFTVTPGSPDTLTAAITADHPSYQPGEVRFDVLPYAGAAAAIQATPLSCRVLGASQILPYHEWINEGVWALRNDHIINTGEIGADPTGGNTSGNGVRRLRGQVYDAINNDLGTGSSAGAQYSFAWSVDDPTIIAYYYDGQYDADHFFFAGKKPGRTTIRVVGTPGFETPAGLIYGEWEVIVMGLVSAEIVKV